MCLTDAATRVDRPPPRPLRRPAAAEGVLYRIRAELPEPRLQVFRAGPMARLRHRRVVQVTGIAGGTRLAVSRAD